MKSFLKILGVNSDFERLFFSKEFDELSGVKRRIILALILILFLTLLALGYAVGSIQNLESKMNNPFTNWVDLSIRDEFVSRQSQNIQSEYRSKEKMKALQINDVNGWVIYNLEFFHRSFNPTIHKNDTLSYGSWGRSLGVEDPLMDNVISEDNLIWKSDEIDWESKEQLASCEIIVKIDLLQRLGFNDDYENLDILLIREGNQVFTAKVIAVISELPKFCEFITSPQFYNIKNARRDGTKNCGELILQNNENNSNYFFLVDRGIDLISLKKTTNEYFVNASSPDIRLGDEYRFGDLNLASCEMSFLPADNPTVDSLAEFIKYAAESNLNLVNLTRFECNVDYCEELTPTDYYYLAFNFNRLDDIREFRNDIKENFGVEIDMSQIEAKENFALVSRLTLAISTILLAFGILSIILFVNSLLRSHLSKVRPNLGTFKAFGLSNYFLNTIYVKIIFSFLLLSISFAFFGAMIVDRLENFVMGEESQFNIFSPWILAALCLLILISLFISSRTIKSILGDTPGNLIYGR